MKEFVVKLISGEYATLADENGEELFIALALLPSGIDEGSRVLYSNGEFEILP